MFRALVQQESGGQAGVPGQMTAYGRPMGATQLLSGTGEEMAGKLGVPWRPELLSRTDEAARRYQLGLGRAYFDEGLAKTGNIRDALRYYHGGPNRAIWGPKTNRYADEVLARVRGR